MDNLETLEKTATDAVISASATSHKKFVFAFHEGDGKNKQLLGGKGANLCEMTQIGLNVPPGFVISTEACLTYLADTNRKLPAGVMQQVKENLIEVEHLTGKKFGNPENPLLVSVRSGSALSMPGMMDTILNLGLNDETVAGLAAVALWQSPQATELPVKLVCVRWAEWAPYCATATLGAAEVVTARPPDTPGAASTGLPLVAPGKAVLMTPWQAVQPKVWPVVAPSTCCAWLTVPVRLPVLVYGVPWQPPQASFCGCGSAGGLPWQPVQSSAAPPTQFGTAALAPAPPGCAPGG